MVMLGLGGLVRLGDSPTKREYVGNGAVGLDRAMKAHDEPNYVYSLLNIVEVLLSGPEGSGLTSY
jgi:hypothetical protein